MEDERDPLDRRTDELLEEGKERGRRGGGGKLSRSETITVRLDPRLNYLTDLAARAQRRTKSSFVEWAVERALSSVHVPGTGAFDEQETSIADFAQGVWDVDEADRLANLAFHAPILLTHEEQVLWKAICNYTYVWRGRWDSVNDFEEEWKYSAEPKNLLRDRLRDTFDRLKLVAQDEAKPDSLPYHEKRRPKASKAKAFDADLDDDVPF